MRKLIGVFIFALMILAAVGAYAGEDAHHGHHPWGYSGELGPDNWGALGDEYGLCGSGHAQSPINIIRSNTIRKNLPPIQFAYGPTPLVVINNGHTVQVNVAPGSTVTLPGKTYELLQFHFHVLSENTVQNKYYDMEMHLVHKAADGSLGVVGVLFKIGAENPQIAKIFAAAPDKAGPAVTAEGRRIDPAKLLPDTQDYYHWVGSLTTPPCSEKVQWYLLKKPLEISTAQAAALFKKAGGYNFRPTQPLWNRPVYNSGGYEDWVYGGNQFKK